MGKYVIFFVFFGLTIEGEINMPEKDKPELTPLQLEVTQNCGTEPAFRNEYWNNKQDGIYVDIISGKPLFCSIHKYDSGTFFHSHCKDQWQRTGPTCWSPLRNLS